MTNEMKEQNKCIQCFIKNVHYIIDTYLINKYGF
jgi:hypothetical protein